MSNVWEMAKEFVRRSPCTTFNGSDCQRARHPVPCRRCALLSEMEGATGALSKVTHQTVVDLAAMAPGVGAGCACSECHECRDSLNIAAAALDALLLPEPPHA